MMDCFDHKNKLPLQCYHVLYHLFKVVERRLNLLWILSIQTWFFYYLQTISIKEKWGNNDLTPVGPSTCKSRFHHRSFSSYPIMAHVCWGKGHSKSQPPGKASAGMDPGWSTLLLSSAFIRWGEWILCSVPVRRGQFMQVKKILSKYNRSVICVPYTMNAVWRNPSANYCYIMYLCLYVFTYIITYLSPSSFHCTWSFLQHLPSAWNFPV